MEKIGLIAAQTRVSAHKHSVSAFRSPTPAFQSLSSAFRSQPSTLRSQPSAFRSQPSAFRSQPSAFRSQSPAFRSQSPAFRSQPPALRSQSSTLRSQPPALRSPTPTVRSQSSARLALVALLFSLIATLPLAAQDFKVEFDQLGDGLWLHRSYALYGGVKTPSNGLLVATDSGLLLVDTAWTPGETQQILDYAKIQLGKEIKLCVITHSHADRAGGLSALLAAKIPVRMHPLTRKLLGQAAVSPLVSDAVIGTAQIDGLGYKIDYFGPAHTVDNITLWFGTQKVLFGGCLVKSADAPNLGNTTDADLKAWPGVLQSLIKSYPDAKIVIPGHGRVGTVELLRHTLALAEAGK